MENIFGNDLIKLNKEVEMLCKESKVVGANVALFDNEKILYSYNYGYINKAANLKSTNDCLYMIGSNTKVMTALGIFKLLEDHKISLEDDIKKHIPEFQIKSLFEYEKISIENLLMHRAGINSDLHTIIYDPSRDYHEVLDEIKEIYLTAPPGEMFSYSNYGYTLLGIIIERVSGLSYLDYIKNVITDPLGIQIYFLEAKEEKQLFSSVISLSYNEDGEEMDDLTYTLIPAGTNTYMSINDFVKFGQIFLNKDNTIFKKETLELMETLNVKEQIDHELINIGYGLYYNYYDFGESVGKIFGHGGDTTCHHSMFNYIPGLNIGVVTLTNSKQAAELSRELGLTVLIKYLKRKGYIKKEVSQDHKIVDRNCDEYMGHYVTMAGLIEIKKNEKQELVVQFLDEPDKLLPCEDGYLERYPKQLHKLSKKKKSLIKSRLKLIKYYNKDVLIIEQTFKYYKMKLIFGCRYEETEIPDTFREACGHYEPTKEYEYISKVKLKCGLCIENNMLMLNVEVEDVKGSEYLKVVNDNLAFTQGIGRDKKEMIEIKKNGDDFYLIYAGVCLKRVD